MDCRNYDTAFMEWSKDREHGDMREKQRELHRKLKEGRLKAKEAWTRHESVFLANEDHNVLKWRYDLWQRRSNDAEMKLEEADKTAPDNDGSGVRTNDVKTQNPRPAPRTQGTEEVRRVTDPQLQETYQTGIVPYKPITIISEAKVLIDHRRDVLRLPDNVGSVLVTRPRGDQPVQVNLPWTETYQHWCVIRVNMPSPTVICPESRLSLKVSILKKAVKLAVAEKALVDIPISMQEEADHFGVYAVPKLNTHVFVGPFTPKWAKSSNRPPTLCDPPPSMHVTVPGIHVSSKKKREFNRSNVSRTPTRLKLQRCSLPGYHRGGTNSAGTMGCKSTGSTAKQRITTRKHPMSHRPPESRPSSSEEPLEQNMSGRMHKWPKRDHRHEPGLGVLNDAYEVIRDARSRDPVSFSQPKHCPTHNDF